MTQVGSQTVVLDPATMAKALTRLTEAINNGHSWKGVPDSAAQAQFLTWYHENRELVESLSDFKTEVSDNATVLNKFLMENGFAPMFREIPPGGLGAAAILDMLVEWAVRATRTEIFTYDNGEEEQFGAFHIPDHATEVYDVSGQHEKLVKLMAKDGSAVWIIMADQPNDGLDLLQLATNTMAGRTRADTTWLDGAIVPILSINTSVSLDWMLGATCGGHTIDQAFQQVRLRMNEEGARVKAMSGFATRECVFMNTAPVTFDRPFAGWFTQADSEVPIALFYAAKDSWKSEGDLASL